MQEQWVSEDTIAITPVHQKHGDNNERFILKTLLSVNTKESTGVPLQ